MISTQTREISYLTDGTTVDFAVPFPVISGDHITCKLDGSTVTNYIYVSETDPDLGGSIQFSSAPSAGLTLLIYRTTPCTQLTDYVAGDRFPAEVHENALDKLTLIAQEIKDDLNDAIIGTIDVVGTTVVGGLGVIIQVETGDAPDSPTDPATIPAVSPGEPAHLLEIWKNDGQILFWYYNGSTWSLTHRSANPYSTVVTSESELTVFEGLAGHKSALIVGEVALTNSHTIDFDKTLAFAPGGSLDLANSSAEILIDGEIQAGRYRIFSNFTGSAPSQAFKIQGRMNGTDRYPEWWGALPDFEPVAVESGSTHDGSDGATTLTDSTAAWTEDEWAGYQLFNTVQRTYGDITGNTATTITADMDGSGKQTWDSGEGYLILSSYGNSKKGAVGTAETDSTEGIQYAINSGTGGTGGLNSQNYASVISLGTGNYKTTSTIDCRNRFVYVDGKGVFRTNIYPHADTAFSTFKFGSASGQDWGLYDQKFRHFYVRFKNHAAGAGWIAFEGSDDIGEGTEISDVWSVGWTSGGVQVSSNASVLGFIIRDCSFNSANPNLGADAVGIYLGSGGDQTTIERVTFNNNVDRQIKVRASGSHDGISNTSSLVDSSASWTVDQWVGFTVRNVTDGSYGIVTANTANSLSAVLSGGTDNDWDDTDVYTIQDTLLPDLWTTIITTTGLEDYTVGGNRSGNWPADNNVDTEWRTDNPVVGAPDLGTSIGTSRLMQIFSHGGEGRPSTFREWNHAAIWCWGTNGAQIKECHIEGYKIGVKIGGFSVSRVNGYATGASGGDSMMTLVGDGSTTVFNTRIDFLSDEALTVKVGGVTQTLGTDYTLTGEGGSNIGVITFTSAPGNGVAIDLTASQITGFAGRIRVSDMHMDGVRTGVHITGKASSNSASSVIVEGIARGTTDPPMLDYIYDVDTGVILGSGPEADNGVLTTINRYSRQSTLSAAPGPYFLVWSLDPPEIYTKSKTYVASTGLPGEITLDPSLNQEMVLDCSDASATDVVLPAPIKAGVMRIIRSRQDPLNSSFSTTISTDNVNNIDDSVPTPNTALGSGSHTSAEAVPSVTLTIVNQVTVGDSLVLGGKTYTFVSIGTADEDGKINIGAAVGDTRANIVAAINGTDGVNTAHSDLSAAAFSGDDCVISEPTVAGEEIEVSETFTDSSNVLSSATLLQTLEDSAASYSSGEFSIANHILHNTTDGSKALVVSNTGTTITVKTLEGGADNKWSTSDLYVVRRKPVILLPDNTQSVQLIGVGGKWTVLSGVGAFIQDRSISNISTIEELASGGSPDISTLDKVITRFDLDGGNYTPTMGKPRFEGQVKIIYSVKTTGSNTVSMTPANCNTVTTITFSADNEALSLIGIAGKWHKIGGDA